MDEWSLSYRTFPSKCVLLCMLHASNRLDYELALEASFSRPITGGKRDRDHGFIFAGRPAPLGLTAEMHHTGNRSRLFIPIAATTEIQLQCKRTFCVF